MRLRGLKRAHDQFFAELQGVTNVIILGHSLGEVDWPYFQRIDRMAPSASRTFSYYNENDQATLTSKVDQMIGIAAKRRTMITLMNLCSRS